MMKQTRRSRFFTAIFALCMLLFAQLALAGYHCPGVGSEPAHSTGNDADMPCAEMMSMAQEEELGLCHAHCQVSQQSVDNHQPPAPVTLQQLATGLTVELAQPARPMRPQRPASRSSSSPPLTVQNCCFRI